MERKKNILFLFHLRPKENIGTKKQFKGSDQI